jgi:hypothetical protein
MISHLHARVVYGALAALTVALGLLVHSGRAGLHGVAQDVVGDALWATMIAWLIGGIAPVARLRTRGTAAFGICTAVEFSQLIHGPAIDALRRRPLGQLVLGSGFDPRDLAAYALGIVIAVCLESVLGWMRPCSER